MENLSAFFEILLDSEKLIAYGGLTLLLFIIYAETGLFFGFIFPGDALLLTAGLLCSTNHFDVDIFLLLFSVTGVAILGNITGYLTGKYLGKKLFTKQDSLFFKKKHLEITRNYFLKYGGAALVVGRFLPFVRTFAPIMAGATEISFIKFNIYNILGAIIWVWSLIPLGFLLGKQFPLLVNDVEYLFIIVAAITTVVFVIGYIKQQRKLKAEEANLIKISSSNSNYLKDGSAFKNKSLLWNINGFIFLAIGISGFILPSIPVMFFFLIAAICFVCGSKKALLWLARHKHAGQAIRDFTKNRGITKRNKGILTITVIPAMLFSTLVTVEVLWLEMTLTGVAIIGILLIWLYKTKL